MSFDWSTLALQTVNFLILVWLLQRFLYRPVLAALDRRRAAVTAAEERAGAAEERAQVAEAEFHKRVEALEVEAAARRRDLDAEAARRAEVVVAEAKVQAQRMMAETRQAIEAERLEAAATLCDRAAGVATTLANRLLAEIAPGVGSAPFLAALQARLAALAPSERALLGHGSVKVEMAPPLTPAEREEWTRHLGADFAELDFAEAPGLIAGARLSTDSAALEVSWADALAGARREMVDHGKPE